MFGILMGVYHQGGIIAAQIWLAQQGKRAAEGLPLQGGMNQVLWWKTYSPPIYLLGPSQINTTDLMGISFPELQRQVQGALGQDCHVGIKLGLVAPSSSSDIEAWRAQGETSGVRLEELWSWQQHVNLDDMDFENEGVWKTLKRVVGRRGLVVWGVKRVCAEGASQVLGGDW